MLSHQIRPPGETAQITHRGERLTLTVRLDPDDPARGPFGVDLRVPPSMTVVPPDPGDALGWTRVVHPGPRPGAPAGESLFLRVVRRPGSSYGPRPFAEVEAPMSWKVWWWHVAPAGQEPCHNVLEG
jgi:hypothetical protein